MAAIEPTLMRQYLDGPLPPGPFCDVWLNPDLVARIIVFLQHDDTADCKMCTIDSERNFTMFVRSLRRTSPPTPSTYADYLSYNFPWHVFQSTEAVLRFLHADTVMHPYLNRNDYAGQDFAYALSYRTGPFNVV